MILSIKERLFFRSVFSANKDSMTEAAVQRSILQLVEISKSEAQEISLTPSGNGFIWDATKGIDKDFDITSEQKYYLKESVFTMSKSKEFSITQDLLPICEKIYSL